MKKITIILLLITTGITTIFAQRHGASNEKIESFQVAFFTQKLNLTDNEAKAFWPIYNQYKVESKVLREKQRKLLKSDFSGISDKELDKLVAKRFEIKQKQLDLEKQYHLKFKKVLPMEKIARLPHVERAFRSALLKKMRENKD
jgi:hypothetical protein